MVIWPGWSNPCQNRLSRICNFWHLGTLILRAERQGARMSKITNDGLTRSAWHRKLYYEVYQCMSLIDVFSERGPVWLAAYRAAVSVAVCRADVSVFRWWPVDSKSRHQALRHRDWLAATVFGWHAPTGWDFWLFLSYLGDFGDDIAMPLATMMIEIVSLITGCAVSQHCCKGNKRSHFQGLPCSSGNSEPILKKIMDSWLRGYCFSKPFRMARLVRATGI